MQQQALNGWLALQKKMGKGTGKHVGRLREEAKKTLAECRQAVPVWIMPLSRVIESFDVSTTRFDVVIIDEASPSCSRTHPIHK
jgi:superfamily I DNA and/or RNA helicase